MRRSTGCWLLWLRADLERERARAYWRGPHACKVGRVAGVEEYRQHHFALEDHGFWPASQGIATAIPPDWRIDGMPEVTYAGTLGGLKALGPPLVEVFRDEANAFDRVLCNMTAPGGARWLRSAAGDEVGARAVALLRRRPGVGLRAFAHFVNGALGGALARADGALEIRTHPFLPYSAALWPTPGVAHDNPPHRRYHAAIVIGGADRAALERVLSCEDVAATAPAQADNCLAVHAYAVDETVAVVAA